MELPIPLAVLYAGLAGTLLALVVATATNGWSPRVFFLLALRLAIGWHFLFEGLHKIHSYYVGPSETNRPFSSEPYFREAAGPLGDYVRKQARVGDWDRQIAEKLTPRAGSADLTPGKSYSESYLLGAVPDAVNADWGAFVARFAAEYKLSEAEKARLDGKESEEERAEREKKTGPGDLTVAAKTKYARWLLGADPRDAKEKYVNGEVPLTVPQRLEMIAHRKAEYERLADRRAADLGQGEGIEMARVRQAKTDWTTAEADLVKDADQFLTDLKKQTVAAVVGKRFEDRAPGPLAAVTAPDAKGKLQISDDKLAALLPAAAPKAGDQPTFDALPDGLKKLWSAYYETFKSSYPLSEDAAKRVDEAYQNATARLANWFFGRDEFDGQPAKGTTFAKLLTDYRAALDAAKKPAPVEAKEVEQAPPPVPAVAGGAATAAATPKPAAPAPKQPTAAEKLTSARNAVLAELEKKYSDLKTLLAAAAPADAITGAAVVTVAEPKKIERLDKITMWVLTIAGACLLAGLFTRPAALVCVAFLVLTYLAHPPYPWLPLPPNTEGNPVFVNKNAIEALALLVIVCFPTGRWLGLDALLYRLFLGGRG